MTQVELDNLKDVTELRCAIFQREQDGIVEDIHGVRWLTGMLAGQPVKRRFDVGGEFLRRSERPNGAEQ